jgi:hypothetical protein
MAEKTPDKETAFLLEYSDSEIFKWNYTNIGPSYNSLPWSTEFRTAREPGLFSVLGCSDRLWDTPILLRSVHLWRDGRNVDLMTNLAPSFRL